ncbi:hypothetical protein KGM_214977 [Danaus plexippus plexippus]|uniref:Uncharacterized protein n=1 Tax=Danaus plexippus plexippus TaxID=278856 RepID=A0A212F130_DANPL|nr:hypothetical protein KGM_214977 [Danaus plexippus plexippus]
MGVSDCVSLRQARGACHCPACPRGSAHGPRLPPQTLVLPPMALEPDTTPVKDKKGSKMKVLKKIKKKIGLVYCVCVCAGPRLVPSAGLVCSPGICRTPCPFNCLA